ncbi:MAG TPA: hypothetical protein PLJ78_05760 [Anaerolineae bacterium]|nr:hypothetical protein [Anaerolineae bacterium]HQI86679.1 hypothetical protein [Anaerolineae bacterium]HQK13431.1 hypothetical protein [Anaerolineae bacterium]
MEFLNIGGGELLVIVLLAIILFGPEDILKMMRKIGEYVRKIQQMWAQVSSGLKGEFITEDLVPEEIQETIKETQASVAEVGQTLAEVKAVAEADLSETHAAVQEVKTTLEAVSSTVTAGVSEVPKALADDLSKLETPQAEVAAETTPINEGETVR